MYDIYSPRGDDKPIVTPHGFTLDEAAIVLGLDEHDITGSIEAAGWCGSAYDGKTYVALPHGDPMPRDAKQFLGRNPTRD